MLQLIILFWAHFFHPFYVSVTQIEQKPGSQQLQVSVRMFYDDFEEALNHKNKVHVNVVTPKDRHALDKMVEAYVVQHLQISINNKPLQLHYVGYEIEEEAAWCYFESDPQEKISRLSIENSLLYEQRKTQINMIHVIVAGKRQSTKLNNPEIKASFSF